MFCANDPNKNDDIYQTHICAFFVLLYIGNGRQKPRTIWDFFFFVVSQ